MRPEEKAALLAARHFEHPRRKEHQAAITTGNPIQDLGGAFIVQSILCRGKPEPGILRVYLSGKPFVELYDTLFIPIIGRIPNAIDGFGNVVEADNSWLGARQIVFTDEALKSVTHGVVAKNFIVGMGRGEVVEFKWDDGRNQVLILGGMLSIYGDA